MTKVSVPGNLGSVTEKTIDSQYLLEMVNQARQQCGEKPVRNNVFVARIEDELEGEGYKTFVTPMDTSKGGADQIVIEMTVKQALRVAARESKAVRRALVDKLEDMQAIQTPKHSDSGLPEYRRAKAEQLKALALEKNIASARELMIMLPRLDPMSHQTLAASLVNPLVGYDAIPLPEVIEHYHTAGEVGQMLGVSAQRIGRLANANNLKTDQYGKFFLDKSRHSDKQVESFRYNAEGVKALRHLLHLSEVA
ncbi:hypothetical protein ACNKCI_000171 [Cronobacter sakazakii]